MRVIYTSAPKLAGAGMGYTAYQLALGIQEQGYLDRLICGYAGANSIHSNLLRTFPLFGLVAWLTRDHTLIRDVFFDLLAMRFVGSCNIVHGWSHQCLHTLRRAKRRGAIAFLERQNSHELTYIDLVTNEEKRFSLRKRGISRQLGRRRGLAEYDVADFITVPSQFVYDSMVAHGVSEGKLFLNPYGVDVDRFRPRPQADKVFRALFVGRVGLRKGVPYLLEAWKGLQLPGAELVLAGRVGPDGRAVVERYQGTSGVKLLGHVTDMPGLYNSATIFVFPSIEEGSALVTYEALASGLPVITTHNSGSIVCDGQEGFLVPIRDVDALTTKIAYLYENPNVRAQMGEAARARAEGYTWEHSRRRLLAAYEQAVQRGTTTGT